jgi:Asp/Glu/hydantoin racemase
VKTRIVLVHAYLPSMAPIDTAFRQAWPEADVRNLLDETIYADVGVDGRLPRVMNERIESLFNHCILSGAHGIVFTGATFGPAVDHARAHISIPVLKAEEAMTEQAVQAGKRILVVCTAARSLPILRNSLDAAAEQAGVSPHIDELAIKGAKDAIVRGDNETHDRLIAEQVAPLAGGYDVVLFGQVSMIPARDRLPEAAARRVLTCAEAAVTKMRALTA